MCAAPAVARTPGATKSWATEATEKSATKITKVTKDWVTAGILTTSQRSFVTIVRFVADLFVVFVPFVAQALSAFVAPSSSWPGIAPTAAARCRR